MLVQVLPKVTLKDSIKNAFNKYCSFKGRVRRSQFWLFYLFILLIILIPTITFIIVCLKDIKKAFKAIKYLNKHKHDDEDDDDDDDEDEKLERFWPLIVLGILLLIDLILFFPLIPLCARRLHDIGKSGYYLLLGLIPFGFIPILIFCAEDSEQNANEYGPSPKYIMMQDDSLLSNYSTISVDGTPYIDKPSIDYSENNFETYDGVLDQGPIEENQEESDISRGSIAKLIS